jgi:hypothetical protein
MGSIAVNLLPGRIIQTSPHQIFSSKKRGRAYPESPGYGVTVDHVGQDVKLKNWLRALKKRDKIQTRIKNGELTPSRLSCGR